MLKKIFKKIIFFLVIMVLLWAIVLTINVIRVLNFKKPITLFVINGITDETGGKYIYPGYSFEVHTKYMGPIYSIKMKFLNITIFDKKIKEIETNRKLENAKIEVLNNSITENNITIVITDTNEFSYGWYGDYEIEDYDTWRRIKIDNDFINDEMLPRDENNQITIDLDISEIYDQLPSGTYRIVKEVYDKSHSYMDIHSNEFEIVK